MTIIMVTLTRLVKCAIGGYALTARH